MAGSIGTLVRNIIEMETGTPADEVGDETPLLSSGLLDSFGVVSVITAIEEETGVLLDPAALTVEEFDTIARIDKLVAAAQV